MGTIFSLLNNFRFFCITNYVHSALHLWLCGFCFSSVICTFCYALVIMCVLLCISDLYVLWYDMLSHMNHRIPFGDEYVCGLHTHPWIVPFLDSLRLVFNYALRSIFSVIAYISCVHFGGILPLFSGYGLYFIYVAHLGELRGDVAEIYTWSICAIIDK